MWVGEIARTNGRRKHIRICSYNAAVLIGPPYNYSHWNYALSFLLAAIVALQILLPLLRYVITFLHSALCTYDLILLT